MNDARSYWVVLRFGFNDSFVFPKLVLNIPKLWKSLVVFTAKGVTFVIPPY